MKKAKANLEKHGVSFEAAASAFEDELSATFPGPDHSVGEKRFITYGLSTNGKLLVVPHTNTPTFSALSVPDQQQLKRKNAMKPKLEKSSKDDLRHEYDFDFSTADRGRYAKRLKTEGSNLVLVEPDLAQAFPDSASVNAALRSVVEFAKLSAGITKRSTVRVAKRRAA